MGYKGGGQVCVARWRMRYEKPLNTRTQAPIEVKLRPKGAVGLGYGGVDAREDDEETAAAGDENEAQNEDDG